MVARLITAQFKDVSEFTDIAIINKELDDFIRELRTEYDCICINFDLYDYPPFIKKLEGLKVYDDLDEYHFLIVDLLKLILFRVGHSDEQRHIEKQFKEFVVALIEKYKPAVKIKPLFKDKKQPNKDNDILALIRQQVDITIDN